MNNQDKRPQNLGRPKGSSLKWGEPKPHNVHLRLTETAYKWLITQGGVDYIEQQARQ